MIVDPTTKVFEWLLGKGMEKDKAVNPQELASGEVEHLLFHPEIHQ